MKRLLVTSDDFGMCHSINAGTVLAMTRGIVRSTNLMAPCPWFSEAARLARAHSLPAGIHLTLTCEWDQLCFGPLTSSPRLRDERGYFPTSHEEVAEHVRDGDVVEEFEAQIERVRRSGIEPTHLDTHMLPPLVGGHYAERIQAIVAELSARHHLPYTYAAPGGRLAHFRDMLEISSFDDATVAARLTGWDEPGDYHLSGHAGVASAELAALSSLGTEAAPWSQTYRARDLAFFTDPRVREGLLAAGFTLVGIRELFD